VLEQIDLRMMAEWAIDTHEFAGFPVVKITCIGHADRAFSAANVLLLATGLRVLGGISRRKLQSR
jgi:hypothetical protein